MCCSHSNSRGILDGLLLMSVASLGVVLSQLEQQACADDAVNQGRIVAISPNAEAAPDATATAEASAEADQQVVQTPAYWIGIQGGPIADPILRTHLQLADDVGVVVMDVVPKSPADKAGLKKHDILLSVNGEPIENMLALQKAVAEGKGKAIELKVIRVGQETTVTVTPEERPKDFQALNQKLQGVPGLNGDQGLNFNFETPMGDLEGAMKQLQQGGFRMFGPGMIGQAQNMAILPGGVSVTITRDGDQPAKIVVKKGDETWEVAGDDQEALAKLPDDVRPFVEQMLAGQLQGGAQQFGVGGDNLVLPPNFNQQLNERLRAQLGERAAQIQERAEAARAQAEQTSKRFELQMKEMEKRLEALQKRLETQLPEAPPAEEHAPADPSST